MGLGGLFRSVVDRKFLGKEIITKQIEVYYKQRSIYPDQAQHVHLAQVWLSRQSAHGIDINSSQAQTLSYTETLLFACVQHPTCAEALGLFILHKERPDIINDYREFSVRFDQIMKPVWEAKENGELNELYRKLNPNMQKDDMETIETLRDRQLPEAKDHLKTRGNDYCPRCGNQINAGSRFCQKCGLQLSQYQSNKWKCKECGKLNDADARRCSCGRFMEDVSEKTPKTSETTWTELKAKENNTEQEKWFNSPPGQQQSVDKSSKEEFKKMAAEPISRGDHNKFPNSVKKHELEGEELFFDLVALSDEDVLGEIIKEARAASLFGTTEYDRLQFCLVIYNLIMAIFYVNFYGKDQNKSRAIIDGMFGLFLEKFCKIGGGLARAGIGTLVVDPIEIEVISSGIANNTLTGFGDLVGAIYDLRLEQYSDAFSERFVEQIGRAADPVVKLFVRHFSGKSWQDNFQLTTFFHVVLSRYDKTVSEMVVNALRS
jgi:hypothetical protein